MRILYLGEGSDYSTSKHRASALQRLGHTVDLIDMRRLAGDLIGHPLWGKFHFHTGYEFLQWRVHASLNKLQRSLNEKYDVVWVNSGELLGAACVKSLLGLANASILYINDDPTGGRDGARFRSLRRAISQYSLAVVVRRDNEIDFANRKAQRVLRVFMSYDEIAHAPLNTGEPIPSNFRSEIAFLGTWMRREGRHEFVDHLINAGLRVNIWGDRWHKAPNWKNLKPFWKGPGMGGREYVAAIQGAKICLGLLSKGNRDLHTTRSAEIPYAGGLLCAERTSEHLQMYRENEDAVFWSTPAECIAVCKRLLEDDTERARIRQNGMRRVRELKVGNEDIARQVLAEVAKL